MHPSIEVSVLRTPDCVRVAVRGALDLATADSLAGLLEPLVAETPALLVLDLGAVRFVDASGLRAITTTAHAVSDRGGRLVLARPSWMLRRMLTVLELEALLPVQD